MSGRIGSWAGDVLPCFVGHESREPEATSVCTKSLRRHSTIPLHIQLLHEPSLRHAGFYRREWTSEGLQKIDTRDGKPYSTSFAWTRWLIPALMQWRGVALFCDSDFLFLDDVRGLADLFDPSYAVQVVKHDYRPAEGVKMDGQAQQPYFRKNWSSLMLFNCSHASNLRLTPWAVNHMSGQWLHGFSWLDDDEIGELPKDWNFLVGVDGVEELSADLPAAAHFTRGVPGMPDREPHPFDDLWRAELAGDPCALQAFTMTGRLTL